MKKSKQKHQVKKKPLISPSVMPRPLGAASALTLPDVDDGNYSDSEAGRAGRFLGLGHDYVPGDPGL